MQAVIFVAILIFNFSYARSKTLNHKDYPYALLTQDHGILSNSDLAINSFDTDPVPFSGKHSPYPYWKCFEVSKTNFSCDTSGNSSVVKEQNAVQIITVQDTESEHFYMPRRATDLKNCRWFQKRWENATKGERFVCISGAFADYGIERGHRTSIWVFDKFKTHKSCTSFFADQCDIKAVMQNGCDI